MITGRKGLISGALFVLSPRRAARRRPEAEGGGRELPLLPRRQGRVLQARRRDGAVRLRRRGRLRKSVHGTKIACTGCHPAQAEVPHPEVKARTKAEFAARSRTSASRCHFDNYTKTLDSVHFAVDRPRRRDGARSAWTATARTTSTPARRAATRDLATLRRVPPEVAARYVKSVHGRALARRATRTSPSAPTATARTTSPDPQATSWTLKTPELCATLPHEQAADEEVRPLDRRRPDLPGGLPRHDARRSRAGQDAAARRVAALCIDCHGVHDITKTEGGRSRR